MNVWQFLALAVLLVLAVKALAVISEQLAEILTSHQCAQVDLERLKSIANDLEALRSRYELLTDVEAEVIESEDRRRWDEARRKRDEVERVGLEVEADLAAEALRKDELRRARLKQE